MISQLRRNPLFRRAVIAILRTRPNERHDLFGSPIVFDPTLELGYALAYRQQDYSNVLRNDIPVLLSLATILGPNDTFLDIGANVGFYSSILSRMKSAFPLMAFHAFEVNPHTAQRLRHTLEGRGVEIHEHGLSDRNADIVFSPSTTSGLFRANGGGTGTAYPVRRLDDCGINGDSLVMKIDVEGHEYEVLEGAKGIFEAGRVKAVYVDGYDDPRVFEFLRSLDFRFFDGLTMNPHTTGTLLLAMK